MLPALTVILPELLWLEVTMTLPPASVIPLQVAVLARTTVPELTVKVPVAVFVPLKVCVPVPILVMLRVLAPPWANVPAKTLSALLAPTFRLLTEAFVVTVPAPARPPMTSEPVDIARVEPALIITLALSGIPFKRPAVAAPTWTMPSPEIVRSPVKVFAPTRPMMARPVPMKFTLPVPVIPPKSVRSAALASSWTSRARTMLLKPKTPAPATLAAEPMVAVPVPLAETTILFTR